MMTPVESLLLNNNTIDQSNNTHIGQLIDTFSTNVIDTQMNDAAEIFTDALEQEPQENLLQTDTESVLDRLLGLKNPFQGSFQHKTVED